MSKYYMPNSVHIGLTLNILQTTDGGYLVSGHQKSFNKHFDMMAIKTDAMGHVK